VGFSSRVGTRGRGSIYDINLHDTRVRGLYNNCLVIQHIEFPFFGCIGGLDEPQGGYYSPSSINETQNM